MLGIAHFPLFVAAVFLLNITPGPDTAYIVGRSVAQGRGAGLMSSLGIGAGCCVHALASAVGLTALLAASASAFTVIKVVGAGYLIYLGVRLLMARQQKAAEPLDPIDPAYPLNSIDASEASGASNGATDLPISHVPAPPKNATAPRPLGKLFTQGFLTNVLNPKVVLFFVSFFPQFVAPTSASRVTAFLVLGGVFVVMSVIWNSFVAWVAGSVTQRFAGKPMVRKVLDRTVGCAFIGLGLKLATTPR